MEHGKYIFVNSWRLPLEWSNFAGIGTTCNNSAAVYRWRVYLVV